MTGQRWRQYIVMALEDWQHELPGLPRIGEAVQAHHGSPDPPQSDDVKARHTSPIGLRGHVSNHGR